MDFDIDVDWRGFELHPETPHGGLILEKVMGAKRVGDFSEYLKRFAADFDVSIKMPLRISNTRRAMSATEYARDLGKLEPFRDAVMDAYWLDGKDIETDGVLREAAERAGLNPKDALSAADDPSFLEKVDSAREEAHARGVSVIPTFIIGELKLVGCQPYENLLKFAEKAGLQAR